MRNVLIFILTILIVFLLGDRFIFYSGLAEVSNNEIYTDIGRGRRTNHEFVKFNEGFSITKFNEYRYLGPGYKPDRDSSIFRIALLGDSFVEGFQVFDRHHFRALLEDKLSSQWTSRKIEVLNFGRSHFDIGDMYCYKKLLVNVFKPDLTIVLLSEDDYLLFDSDPLLPELILNDSLIIVLSQKINLLKDTPFVETMFQHSALVNLLNNGRKRIQEMGWAEAFLDQHFIRSTDSPAEETIIEISDIVHKILAEFAVDQVLIVNRNQISSRNSILALQDTLEIPYIDLTGKLTPTTQFNPYYWDITNTTGHLNHEGHKLLARELSAYILSNYPAIK